MCEHIESIFKDAKIQSNFIYQRECGICQICFMVILPQKKTMSIPLANMLKDMDTIIPSI